LYCLQTILKWSLHSHFFISKLSWRYAFYARKEFGERGLIGKVEVESQLTDAFFCALQTAGYSKEEKLRWHEEHFDNDLLHAFEAGKRMAHQILSV
jgi:hypothetical protein